MNRIQVLLVVLFTGTSIACSSPEDQLCSKQQQCSLLGGQTESQCASNADSCTSRLRQGSAACSQIADALDALDSCEANFGCVELQSTAAISGCETQIEALTNAVLNAGAAGCPACATSDAGS